MNSIRLLFLMIFIGCLGDVGAIQEYWTKGFRNQRTFDSPAPFEKIYVTQDQIISLQDGIYLKKPCGDFEKVRALLQDCEGMYVLLIQTQCPLCGESYSGKACPDGMGCPMYQVETKPYCWSSP